MCGIIDDILPIVGSVAGFALGGPVGAAIGGGLGGFTGSYAQNHNILGGLMGGVTGGIGGYFGGGSLANALGNLGNAGVGAASAGFDTSLASNVAPSTLGGLESGAGGAAMFGPAAGTGTAIGSNAAGALGGGGLGLAGGDALSGVSSNPTFLGGLGGGFQGTGLGVGGQGSSISDLSGVMSGTGGGGGITAGTGEASPSTLNAPVSNMSSMQSGTGITSPMASPNPTSPIGSNVMEGSQAANATDMSAGGGVNGASLEGSQAATSGTGPSNLAALYGPDSTAAGSPMGQGIANSASTGMPGVNDVQYGALGEGATSGASKGMGDDLSSLYGQVSPWMKLANAGLGAYQQYARQNAMDNYTNQINQMYSPNSPYAQQMQQTLARQDAANGRNSQYGTRATQLAAALTEARTRALTSNPYFSASTATPGASMLNGLFANFGSPQGMQALGQIGSSTFNGLSSLFSGF
jgi:hypothetical protein